MEFRKANENELGEILGLYKSMIGSEFCFWNEYYPGEEEIEHDFAAGGLYVLAEKGQIIGAASIISENEMSDYPFWKVADGAERELARVVIAREFQGKGLASELVKAAIDALQKQGCTAVHLAVDPTNIPANRLYARLGFQKTGEAEMYNKLYYLLEKNLSFEGE